MRIIESGRFQAKADDGTAHTVIERLTIVELRQVSGPVSIGKGVDKVQHDLARIDDNTLKSFGLAR